MGMNEDFDFSEEQITKAIRESLLTKTRRTVAKRIRTMQVKATSQDKARMTNTLLGEVPLRRGKYGMDIEEYLEWKEEERTKYKVEPK